MKVKMEPRGSPPFTCDNWDFLNEILKASQEEEPHVTYDPKYQEDIKGVVGA